MNDLNTYINNFTLMGELPNNFDEFGNINLYVSGSKAEEIFLSYELMNENYDNDKIKELYDVNITKDLNNINNTNQIDKDLLYSEKIIENEKLKEKLNNLIITANSGKTENEIISEKDLIINLRLQLNQGQNSTDFEDVFPYNPK